MSGDLLRQQLNELFGADRRIGSSPNTKALLKQGVAAGLVRRTGNMRERPSAEGTIKFFGRTIPLVDLWDEYELVVEAAP